MSLKESIDQYISGNVYDGEKPGGKVIFRGDELQELIDGLYEDVIEPRQAVLMKFLTDIANNGANEILEKINQRGEG